MCDLLWRWRATFGLPRGEPPTFPEPHILLDRESFPTPTVYDATGHGIPRAEQREGSRHAVSLHHVVAGWRPKVYPTPISRDHRSGLVSDEVFGKNSRPLNEVVAREEAILHPDETPAGMLNPDWAEWLMGWPPGWTDCRSTAAIDTWDASVPALDWWVAEPDLPRLARDTASRVERLTAIGNGQVPLCAAAAFLSLFDTMGQADRIDLEAATAVMATEVHDHLDADPEPQRVRDRRPKRRTLPRTLPDVPETIDTWWSKE